MKRKRIHENWVFWKAEKKDDAKTIQLPHDAMLWEERIPDMENGSGSGYYPGGKYYYSKSFIGKEEYNNQSVILEFEGIYMNSTVYLNGEKVGGWIYGYTNFFVDITDKIKIGMANVLLVEVDNSNTPNSRWYSGSGIYRPVNMWTGGKTHIKPQGIRIHTLSIDPAIIQVSSAFEIAEEDLEKEITIEYKIYDGDKMIGTATGGQAEIKISNPKLWSAKNPYLYLLKAELKVDGVFVDEVTENFGIRIIKWNVEDGLQVNGVNVKLRGGCIHHDNGILGACSFEKAEERRIQKLKEFGFNAIRESHYPASKNLLMACDRLGMYVLEESFDQWCIPNTKYDYSTCFDQEWNKDLTALVEKDYNHPSVIMYCIGNEITDTGRSYGAEIAKKLYDTVKQMDNTRPVTIATNVYLSLMGSFMEQKELEQGKTVGSIEVNEVMAEIPEFKKTLTAEKIEKLVGPSFDMVDISGYNYGHDLYQKTHELCPNRIILSSETNPAKMADNWKWVKENPWCIGDFLWTAWDYLGEAGVGLPVYGTKEAPFAKPYPCLTAACGSFDLIGNPEAAAYYEAIIWERYRKPYIGVRPVNHSGEEYTVGGWRLTDAIDCWTWDGCEGKKAEIIVYSIGTSVQLIQNGEVVETKKLIDYKAEFEVNYYPGKLEAVSYDEAGLVIEHTSLQTNGNGEFLTIKPEQEYMNADSEEIVYVPIYVTDENGAIRMMTDKKIKVTVEGEGSLLALGSGKPDTDEKFWTGEYTTWHGCALAVIKSNGNSGTIKVNVSAEKCLAASVEINMR